MAEGAASGGGRGGSRMTGGGHRVRRTMSAGDAEAVGEDNFIDVDVENGEDDVEEQGIFPNSGNHFRDLNLDVKIVAIVF